MAIGLFPDEFTKLDTDFQPGTKVKIVFDYAFRMHPNISQYGVVDFIERDGRRNISVYDNKCHKYRNMKFGRRSSIQKVNHLPEEMFVI